MHVLRVRYHKRCPHIDEFLTSKHLSRWIRTFARTIGVRAWISKPCLPLHLITYSFFSLFFTFFLFFSFFLFWHAFLSLSLFFFSFFLFFYFFACFQLCSRCTIQHGTTLLFSCCFDVFTDTFMFRNILLYSKSKSRRIYPVKWLLSLERFDLREFHA